jgi:erythritol transport system substrate-binding protein
MTLWSSDLMATRMRWHASTRGGIRATVLQPIVQLAESAVEQADHYVKTGKADKLEKQTYDCILVTGENSKSYNGFHLTSGSQ